jgi:hypothetical protein
MRQAAFCWRFGCCYFSACWLSVPVVKNQNKKRREKKSLWSLTEGEKSTAKQPTNPPFHSTNFLLCLGSLTAYTGNIRRRFSTGEDGKTTRVLPPRYRPRNK